MTAKKQTESKRNILPVECYYYMHNPLAAIRWIWKFDLPDLCAERIIYYWYVKFSTDCSGRSTAKSHNAIAAINAKLILLPGQKALLLGLDKKIGIEFFDSYITPWTELYPDYARFVVPFRGKGDAKPTHKDSGAYLKYVNGSVFFTFSPDWKGEASNIQSHRVNRLIFNEWTSYPNMSTMEETVEPIASKTNYLHQNTRLFQEAMERHLGEPLGLMSDEELAYSHQGEPNYYPRQHLKESATNDFEKIKDAFLRNFKLVYQFEYSEGLAYEPLGFKPINTRQDIRDFFRLFTEGDMPYQNQIIYDGSAKEPETQQYDWIRYLGTKLGQSVEELGMMRNRLTFDEWTKDKHVMDHKFSYYSISVDELPRKYDGVIFDSGTVNKFRQNHLDEEFQRVYGGKWYSKFSMKPFPAELIDSCRVKPGDAHYFEAQTRGNLMAVYIGAIDAAKGTEAMRKSPDLPNTMGDEAAMAVFELGQSTPENPDKLVFIGTSADVRSDSMAYDIQVNLETFRNMILLGIDPGGGGGNLADSLKKTRIEKNGDFKDCAPIVPIDYESDEPSLRKIAVFMSRSTALFKQIQVWTDDEKAKWKGDDMLKNYFVSKAQLALHKKTVAFPPYYTDYDKVQMMNSGQLGDDRFQVMQNIDDALRELTGIKIKCDPKTGKPILTANNMFQYIVPHKKEMVVIYGLYLIWVWREWETAINEANGGGPIIV
jgi:hypothetical protein